MQSNIGTGLLVLMNKNFVSKSDDHANYSASAWPPYYSNSLILKHVPSDQLMLSYASCSPLMWLCTCLHFNLYCASPSFDPSALSV